MLEKCHFPIRIIFKKPKFKISGLLVSYIRVDAGPSGRLQFLINQFLSGGVILYKALGLNRQTSQGRSVLLRRRALYFPVQHETGR